MRVLSSRTKHIYAKTLGIRNHASTTVVASLRKTGWHAYYGRYHGRLTTDLELIVETKGNVLVDAHAERPADERHNRHEEGVACHAVPVDARVRPHLPYAAAQHVHHCWTPMQGKVMKKPGVQDN